MVGSAARDAVEGAVSAVPAGAWVVGVSAGADSVALLRVCASRGDLRLHVVHMDHELRGAESAGDARFVAELAARLGLSCTIARRGQMSSKLARHTSPGLLRELRRELFREVCAKEKLDGVLLGHQRDDQAETVFARLVRGSSIGGLGGMSARTVLGGLVVVRPLLGLGKVVLRQYLTEIAQEWREDSSNALPTQQRNRIRMLLAARPGLVDALIELADSAAAWRVWVDGIADWPAEIVVAQAAAMARPAARVAAARWLAARGATTGDGTPATVRRLIEMVEDAASSAAMDAGNGVHLRRRGGVIRAE